MLATEETKTVWKDNHGNEYTSKEDAEYNSVKSMIGPAADNRWVISPHLLLEQLKKHPEAKSWLLGRLGAKSADRTSVLEERLAKMLKTPAEPGFAKEVAYDCLRAVIAPGEGLTGTKVKSFVDQKGVAALWEGVGQELQLFLQEPAAQPQQEVELVNELITAAGNVMSYSIEKPTADWLRAIGMQIEKAGYKLVKA